MSTQCKPLSTTALDIMSDSDGFSLDSMHYGFSKIGLTLQSIMAFPKLGSDRDPDRESGSGSRVIVSPKNTVKF